MAATNGDVDFDEVVGQLEKPALLDVIAEIHASYPEAVGVTIKHLQSLKTPDSCDVLRRCVSETFNSVPDVRRASESVAAKHRSVVLQPSASVKRRAMKKGMVGGHKLKTKTFFRTVRCAVCEKPLRGLLRQGLMCAYCQCTVHSKCIGDLPTCNETPT
eukprot:m.11395 g.11395  ORF g.11395 m.11395 type:complete len:159 (+) comp3988_c0_seq1:395-871(+)